MARKPKTVTPRVNRKLSKALCHELGYKRTAKELLICVSSIYSLCGGRGLALKDVELLFMKYPSLLTWSDFKITKLEDLDQFVTDKAGYEELLKTVVLGRFEEA